MYAYVINSSIYLLQLALNPTKTHKNPFQARALPQSSLFIEQPSHNALPDPLVGSFPNISIPSKSGRIE